MVSEFNLTSFDRTTYCITNYGTTIRQYLTQSKYNTNNGFAIINIRALINITKPKEYENIYFSK